MITQNAINYFHDDLEQMRKDGLYKKERIITSPQDAVIEVNHAEVLNFCANNYLGLADHPKVIAAAKVALDQYGFGLASVRFICGTQNIHKELEQRLSQFIAAEDTILYSSCFDANGGLFETLFNEEDAIISDELNHASIIDGIRLCKAKRFRYKHNDMQDLEQQLKAAADSRFRCIATDGVFSMDGTIADLKTICELAKKYDAMIMVDDCHATGFLGEKGRGTAEYCGVLGQIDITTGTLGKALGGASGGYVCGRQDIIERLRNRSRPYLFSNSLAPALTAAALEVLNLVEQQEGDSRRQQLRENTQYFRKEMVQLGFTIKPGEHPIVPVMLGDAKLAISMADALLKEGIYVIGFAYPVVPKGQARIRVQLSAAHSHAQVTTVIEKFAKVGRELKVI